MAARRLVLHVGLPKTGSKALQRWCYANRALLGAQGVDYPERGVDPTVPNHQFAVESLIAGKFDAVRNALAEGNSETILLSAEGLTGHLTRFSPAALAAFRDLTHTFDVTVFAVARHADTWLKSFYKQTLVNPRDDALGYGSAMSLDMFSRLPRVQRLLDREALSAALAAAYGASRVTMTDYDGDWLAALLRELGVSAEGAAPLTVENRSLPDRLIGPILQLNRMGLPEETRMAWLAAMQECFGSNSTIVARYAGTPRPDPAMLNRFTAATDEEAATLSELRVFLRR